MTLKKRSGWVCILFFHFNLWYCRTRKWVMERGMSPILRQMLLSKYMIWTHIKSLTAMIKTLRYFIPSSVCFSSSTHLIYISFQKISNAFYVWTNTKFHHLNACMKLFSLHKFFLLVSFKTLLSSMNNSGKQTDALNQHWMFELKRCGKKPVSNATFK